VSRIHGAKVSNISDGCASQTVCLEGLKASGCQQPIEPIGLVGAVGSELLNDELAKH
jgi:hypothetical protein